MNPEYDIYEEIDRYLNGELSEGELLQFNEKLSANPEFKSLVEAQKTANEVVFYQQMSKLKERISNDLNKDNNSLPWGKIILFSALVVSATVYTYINYNQSDSTEINGSGIPATQSQNSKEQINTSIDQPVADKHSKVAAPAINEAAQHDQNSISKDSTKEQVAAVTVAPQTKDAALIGTDKEVKVKETIPVSDQAIKISCENIHITAEIRIDYSFGNDGEATVIIDPLSIRGGAAPYSYALDQSDFDKDNRFRGIKDGTYHVRIKDHNNCISEVKKEVIVKTPRKEIDEAFVPSQGEHWKFPVKDNANADITIINKVGSIVFTTTISNGYPNEWDGRSNTGAELETGNYYFVIKYAANEIVKGHISIVR
ncbi:MAG TPA: gliding motility-associated C-terminal domain-containing protein [Cytophagaceae bacterium]|jgi:gliding motility-associated-like protein|nr:gliding motility-associated C-terminal domain-containing protein [Cytophagaceae bacterium]